MMEQRNFKSIGRPISLLGFGLMRLPLLSADAKDIDGDAVNRMVDRAVEAGVNYFDTAWVYHEGRSETFAGEALSRHPREKYCLATKMPSWVLESAGDVERIFNEQLKKCRVEYFDFYLMHNLGAERYDLALKYNVYEFLRKKKEEGQIRHLGFSMHDAPEQLLRLVNAHEWDFAQIQLNYLDWETLKAKEMYDILSGRGIPIVIMEPVRGGVLASLTPSAEDILKDADAKASLASWAIRYAASLPGVMTVLSGMSNYEQLEDNIKTMSNFRPLSDDERSVLEKAAIAYRASGAIPCTSCRYCMDCPSGVDIPRVFAVYNHYRVLMTGRPNFAEMVFGTNYQALTDGERAHNCVSCGQCVEHCPQGIDIPGHLREITELAAGM
ncbi:MAG: aldo/keto reductase [Synergistaceae bacterium]|jgi:predicted aldo/keto reductase-like oxidoreductase|nr:aldo/keto reductase [Synergistaceae bacterium]